MKNTHPPYRILKLLAETKEVSAVLKKLDGLTEKDVWNAVEQAATIMEEDVRGKAEEYYTVNIDGAAVPNPGPAGIGFVIRDPQGREVKIMERYIGYASNNVAEYTALTEGMKEASRFARNVYVLSDSELIVNQMQGNYRIKDKKLQELFRKAKLVEKKFNRVVYRHIPREENKRADQLANMAISFKA